MTSSNELLQHQLETGAIPLDECAASLQERAFCHPPVAHFGDAVAEYRAAQESAALFDVSDRVQIEMNGKDAQSFLHKFCTNDIERLNPGGGSEAFITNVKGRILAHVYAFVTDDAVWIDSPSTDEASLLSHFDRYLFSEDVTLRGRTETFGDLYVSGAQCVAPLTALGIAVEQLTEMQHALGTVEGLPVVVRRVDFWGQPGFILSADRQQLVVLWQRLVTAGMQPAGAQAFHALRIEAGLPLYGIDLSSDNLAQEAGRTEQAISFTKGCYLGQEPIARIDALGHINRQVSRLRLETGSNLAAAPIIVAADGTDVGTLTSSMVVPGTTRSVALAMLRTKHAQPDTVLTVQSGEDAIAATVI